RALRTFDMLDIFSHAEIQPNQIYGKTMESRGADIDGIFIACTQLRAMEILDALEADLGVPVLSANQVSAWWAYRELGIDPRVADRGSLLRSLSRPTVAGSRPAAEGASK